MSTAAMVRQDGDLIVSRFECKLLGMPSLALVVLAAFQNFFPESGLPTIGTRLVSVACRTKYSSPATGDSPFGHRQNFLEFPSSVVDLVLQMASSSALVASISGFSQSEFLRATIV